ncbi:MAG: hypothetical protein JOZ93_00030 [Sinobacteraceae bacterium]|nr:hypothetical protein [Nevskiaceae bacterium]
MNREESGDPSVSVEEREFDTYLQRRSLLAEHGHEDAAPSAALDAQVLRAAHQAVASPPTARRAPLAWWALPGSLAAAVLVSLAFFMHAGMQTPTTPPISSTADSQTESLRETASAERAGTAPSQGQRTEQGMAAKRTPASALNAAPALDAGTALNAAPALSAGSAVNAPALNTARAARQTGVQQPTMAESDPQAWLARIEALRAEGKQQQADAQLQRLRAAFPDYPVPAANNAAAAAKLAAPRADRPPK